MSEQHPVVTPIPGIFYRRPSPGEGLYTEVGATVAAGATVGMVEIMKSFHPVVCDVAGEVVSILDDLSEVAPGDEVAQIQPGSPA